MIVNATWKLHDVHRGQVHLSGCTFVGPDVLYRFRGFARNRILL